MFHILSEMKQMNDSPIMCYVFEKPNVNTSNEDLTKDGIHIVIDVKNGFNRENTIP